MVNHKNNSGKETKRFEDLIFLPLIFAVFIGLIFTILMSIYSGIVGWILSTLVGGTIGCYIVREDKKYNRRVTSVTIYLFMFGLGSLVFEIFGGVIGIILELYYKRLFREKNR